MIDSELTADRQKGPGFGRLRITKSRFEAEGLRFALMRNQGNTPFLGVGGNWQATEIWHPAEIIDREDTATVIAVGPEVVDAVVAQPANVAFRLMLLADDAREMGTLRIVQPLYGSSAAGGPDDAALLKQQKREAEERRRQEEDENRRRAEEEEERRRQAALEEERLRQEAEAAQRAEDAEVTEPAEASPRDAVTDADQGGKGKRFGLTAGVIALLASAGAGAWFSCLIPGFGPDSCGGPPVEAVSPGPEPAPDAAALTCAGLTSGSDCYAVAQEALARKELEPARQLFQQAASMGSIEANIAVARMYDPKTWSAEASPVGSPNWETAAFWYEKAARLGDRSAQRETGRLLCGNAGTGFEKRQGRTYLEKAAEAGDAEAKTLIETCGG